MTDAAVIDYPTIDPKNVKVRRVNQEVEGDESYDDHEHVFEITSPDMEGKILVAVHNTSLGRALGGTRLIDSSEFTEEEAMKDVLRLSKGMTHKSGAAGHKCGGGKTVYYGPEMTDAVLETLACGLNEINSTHTATNGQQGLYFASEDSGVTTAHITYARKFTPWVMGVGAETANPSPQTARGVVEAILQAAENKFGTRDTRDRTVTIQGVGAVGMEVARILYEDHGVKQLNVNDFKPESAQRAADLYGAKICEGDSFLDEPGDIFVPCARGGILNVLNVDRLHAAGYKAVAGAANNQEEDEDNHIASKHMHELGMLYVPDIIANCIGVLYVWREAEQATEAGTARLTRDVLATARRNIEEVLERYATGEYDNTAVIALEMSMARIAAAEAKLGLGKTFGTASPNGPQGVQDFMPADEGFIGAPPSPPALGAEGQTPLFE